MFMLLTRQDGDFMEKKEKKLYIIIAILFIVICIMIVAILLILSGKKEQSTDGVTQKKSQVEEIKEPEMKEPEMKELEEEEVSSTEMIIALDGFEFKIPSDYSCVIADGVGAVIYMDDMFQMKLAIRDTSYEEIMEDPKGLTEKTIAAGGNITKDVTETELNGQKYSYFYMELEGEKCFVVNTKATNETERFAAQFVILSETITEEDLLNIFAQVISGAVETDESNTTMEDLSKQVRKNASGEKKKKSSLSIAAGTVDYKVTEGYYSNYKNESDTYADEYFTTAGFEVSITCFLTPKEDMGSAKNLIEDEKITVSAFNVNPEVMTTEINGQTFYYILAAYQYNEVKYQNIYAACEVDDNMVYEVKVSAADWEETLTLESIEDFLTIEN